MTLIDNKTELKKYAELYSAEAANGINSTPKYLAFRDLPNLFQKYQVGNNALDLGCGTGISTMFLKSQGFNVHAVDINKEMLIKAKQNDPTGSYINIEADRIPFTDNVYDFVFASFVLLEMSSLNQIQQTLNEATRVLKTGGLFIAILNNENTYKHNWKKINTNFPENKELKRGSKVRVEFIDKGFSIQDYYWTQEDYTRLMSNTGLKLIEIHQPLGLDSDGMDWMDEKFISPISVYITRKQ